MTRACNTSRRGTCHKRVPTRTYYTPVHARQAGDGFFSDYMKNYLKKHNLQGPGNTGIIFHPPQTGEGFMDSMRDLFKSKSSGAAPSDDTGRPAFPGEKHAVLRLANGKPGRANYEGPGTNIVARIQRGDPPRTETDKVSQAHDIRYSLARDFSDVAAADQKFIAKLKAIEKAGGDSKLNTRPARRAIQAKSAAQRMGVLSKSAFSSAGDPSGRFSASDIDTLEKKLAALEQQGYGSLKAGDKAKLKLLRADAKRLGGKGVGLAGGSQFPGSQFIPFVPYKHMTGRGQEGGFLPILAALAPGLMNLFGGQGLGLAGKGQEGGFGPLAAMLLPIALNIMSGKGLGLSGGSMFGDVASAALPFLSAYLAHKGSGLKLAGSGPRIDTFLSKKFLPRAGKALGLTKADYAHLGPLISRAVKAAILGASQSPDEASPKEALRSVAKAVSDDVLPMLANSGLARRLADKAGSAASGIFEEMAGNGGDLLIRVDPNAALLHKLKKEFGSAIVASVEHGEQGGDGFFDKFKKAAEKFVKVAAPIAQEVGPILAPVLIEAAMKKMG